MIDDSPMPPELQPGTVKRRQRRILVIGVLAIVIGVIALQLVPYGRDHTNPPVAQEPAWNSPETRALVDVACFDCHSNETRWPWYASVSPMSMMIYRDVIEGRAALNFSEWDQQNWNQEKSERMAELVAKGEMPLAYYLVLHPEARLSKSQQGQLVNGLLETLNGQQRAGSQP